MPTSNTNTDAYRMGAHLAHLGVRVEWGAHYHAVHPVSGQYHPHGASTRKDAAVLVAAKWRLPMGVIHTAPCWNGTDPTTCPIMRAALDKAMTEAWTDFNANAAAD